MAAIDVSLDKHQWIVERPGVLVSEDGSGPDRVVELSRMVQAARDGDERAFCALYTAVQPGLLRYLRALVGQDAEDVASETWLILARDIHWFRGEAADFRAWAATTGRRRAMDHIRRLDRRPAHATPVEMLTHLPDRRHTEDQAVESVSTDAALELIATLPPDQAEAVLLRVVVGLDAKAAGQVLGKRAGAVRIAAHRGLRRLARVLECNASGAPPPTAVTAVPPWLTEIPRPVKPTTTSQGW